MERSTAELRDDAEAIWRAGLEAVGGERLVRTHLAVEGPWLRLGDQRLRLDQVRRVVVVGAGKAGASMASGVEQALGESLLQEKQLSGWVNVPADCLRPLRRIHLHPARPAGCNEPTAEGIHGSEHMLQMVAGLSAQDVCLCLISGGGSALLPAPVPGVTLEDKVALTRFLSAAGADIRQLNTVRKAISRIKGGGLARACRAGHLITFIISDVLGDPLDMIASGPTVDVPPDPQQALRILREFGADSAGIAPNVLAHLQRATRDPAPAVTRRASSHGTHVIVGNNATAVDGAGQEAERRGYSHVMLGGTPSEGTAEQSGRHLLQMARHMLANPGPDCLISGGEPTVQLIEAQQRGKGGRNQQLVLAALAELWTEPQLAALDNSHGPSLVLLSGGSDGEDGPTDAAGAILTAEVISAARQRGLDPADYLRRNDAYSFFQQVDGLLQTGPTHTNVCDLRVVLVRRPQP